jgi:hypothetical protein
MQRILSATALLCLASTAAFAAGPLGVDVVSLKSGKALRGAILTRQPDGIVWMAVSRDWLKQADPKEYDRQSETAHEQQRAAWQQTRDRIETLLADPPKSQPYTFFLKQESQRLEKQLNAKEPPDAPFFLMQIPSSHVAKLLPAPPDRQRIAMFAWKEGITGVETRPAADLRKDLAAADINLDGPLPDLSDMLPAREQTEAEWSARLAIVGYTLDESLDFQGMGDTLVRTGDGQQVDLAAILPKLLSSQVDSLLGDLLGPGAKPRAQPKSDKDALRPAIAVAEKHQQPGFRVTRLDMNPERMSVAVTTEFVAQAGGKWQTVWRHAESADGSKARPDAEARIANDPQVKSLLASLKGLGLGADDAVTQAIRVGAATMSAQQAADARFFEFRDRYAKRLDGPPLMFPASP